MIIKERKCECFVIHYNGMPLDMSGFIRKVYYQHGYARNGLRQIPSSIRKDCEIVRYTPE